MKYLNERARKCPDFPKKVRFKNERRALESIARRPPSEVQPLRAYKCKGCEGWHLTSRVVPAPKSGSLAR